MIETAQELFWGLILCSLWCIGFRQVFQTGMILGKAGDWLWDKLPEYLSKPFYQCLPCMASVHGILFYIIFMQTGWLLLVPFVITLSGLNSLANVFLDKEVDVINHYRYGKGKI